jgi:hypothetical protein
MDLCTVFSENYILSAVNLIKSYNIHGYNSKIYLYYFNCDKNKLSIFNKFKNEIEICEVEKTTDFAYNPKAFFYKIYAIADCAKKSKSFIYSDSTNCFISDATKIHTDLIDDCLFVAYPYEKLINKYWTTKKCFEIMKSPAAKIMPQYWAAFQAYNMTLQNEMFIQELYKYGCERDCLLPENNVKNPDGIENPCIEHRQDQSILSILIDKFDKHQFYNIDRDNKFGDWQTLASFDSQYKSDMSKRILSPRESKFGYYRYINA